MKLIGQNQSREEQLAHFIVPAAHRLDFLVDQAAKLGNMIFFTRSAGYGIGAATDLQRDIAHGLPLGAFNQLVELPERLLDHADQLLVFGP